MNLFLIEHDSSIDIILSMKEFDKENDVILCFNYLAFYKVKTSRLKTVCYFIEDLYSIDRYSNLMSFLEKVVLGWYKKAGIDSTFYKGISLGHLFRLSFFRVYMTSIAVKNGDAISGVIKKHKGIKNIYYDFSNNHNCFTFWKSDSGKFYDKNLLIEVVAGHFNLPYTKIIPHKYIPNIVEIFNEIHSQKKTGLKNKIIQIYEYIINFSALYLHQIFTKKKKIYLTTYFNLSELLPKLTGRFIVSQLLQKKDFRRSLLKGIGVLRFNEVNYKLSDNDKSFIGKSVSFGNNIDEYAKENEIFKYNGINYSRNFHLAIKDIINNGFINAVKFINQVETAIRKYNIGTIVVLEELHENQQIILEVSKLNNAKTVWIDHGIQGLKQQSDIADRGISDTVLTSGTFFNEYYSQFGGTNRRCVLLGNPSMDPYPNRKRKKVISLKKVLFLGYNPDFYLRIDRYPYQEKFYCEMFSIFKELSEMQMEIYFRPHPSERRDYYKYLFNFFGIDERNVRYSTDKPFNEIVYDMDFIVASISTTYYESFATGIPTIFFEPGYKEHSLFPPLNCKNWEEVIRVETGKEILDLIKKYKDDPTELNNFMEKAIEIYQEKYIGKLDGLASQRIIDYLVNI